MQANRYEDSLHTVLAHCRALPAEEAPLAGLVGRVAAEAVRARTDDPPAPKSAMDGFALRSVDSLAASAHQPVTLAWQEVVGAGHLASGSVEPGSAVRLMTGALLPAGADAVVKQEDTLPAGNGRFALTRPLQPGENVIPAGASLRAGAVLVSPGEPVGPQALGLLASQGLTGLRVHRRPRVALLALGDELVAPGTPLAPGQLYVSNLYALEALAARYGAEPVSLGIAGDDPGEIEARLRTCLPGDGAAAPCDVLLTLGGSHQGDFDFVEDVLGRLGAHLHFRRTLINIGASTLFATAGATLLFGLPGTPAAAWLAFEVLVYPALAALAGLRQPRPVLQAQLTQSVSVRPGRTHFLPARLAFSADGPPQATPLARGTPMALPPSLRANGLIRWPEGTERLEAGDRVPVEWLEAGS